MQKRAIETRGDNLIVSAGAGSGKTAVLSERILKYCLMGNDIRKVLVLTFTNAAALEMKERIRKKLIEHHLLEQASLIDSAAITTFDAYSLSLVKKYYYELGVDKDVKVIDQSLLEVQKRNFLDAIFKNLYEEKNLKFFSLLKKYAKQNDDAVKQMVLSLADKLSLQVDEEGYIKSYQATYGSKEFMKQASKDYEALVLKKYSLFLKEVHTLLALCEAGDEKLSDFCSMLMSLNIRSYDDLVLNKNLSFPRVSSKASEAVKEQKKLCADMLKDILDTYLNKYQNLDEAVTELLKVKEDVIYLLELASLLRKRILRYEYQLMAFDYIDIAKMVIKLVCENEQVHHEISSNLDEILIDEYQDTSDIQEAFILAISNHNCMMVGDLKQSIYRFRNANPYIFKSKYDSYALSQGGIKLDLTHNFRSRTEVLEDINEIFSALMTEACGDANYSKDHQMHFGQENYDLEGKRLDYHLDILSYDKDFSDYSDEEIEAFICGKEILKLMNEKPTCLKGNGFKEVCYSDIAILIDKTKSFVTFKKVFEYLGIPLSIEADLDLNHSILPRLFANVVLMLAKRKENILDQAYYHALCSLGRSFLFSYSDDEIYMLAKENHQNELTHIIDELYEESFYLPMTELYDSMINKFNIYEKLPLIGDIENSCVVLEYIASLFETMHTSLMDLEEASAYISKVFDEGISLKYKLASSATDSVHIMTIHKSKGLEFPFCFFPMLSSGFNQADVKANYGLSRRYGVYIPFSDEASSPTILKALADEETRKCDVSEKVRLLYVALTRAREKIFLISKNEEKKIDVPNYKSFNQMILSLKFLEERRTLVDLNSLGLSKNYEIKKKDLKLPKGEERLYPTVSFESELKEKKVISKELKELVSSELAMAIELGKKFHHCLEVLDLASPDIESLPVDEFMKKTVSAVLNNDLFKNISKAKTYHEYEFYFEEYHGIIDLLAVYEDHIDIIDYKLSSLSSEEYLRQLGIYKTYVENVSKLPVSCYLISILKQDIKKVL